MKIPEGFKMLETYSSKHREMHSIRVQRSLYGLNQSGRMSYNRLIELMNEGTPEELQREKLCLSLQIEYLADEIFIYQFVYTEKILKRFYMDKVHPLKDDEELLGPEILYLNAIGALMYLVNANKGGADHIGYVDVGYLSDSHKVQSQTGYVFTYGVREEKEINTGEALYQEVKSDIKTKMLV
ncbi:uncharacterized protein [Nicotiana tomentosiformis]|uniref:uncharacterized protein n=1 Tax=Nicotiana tomentosiformis TaxID=4098 RepID=UPI00388C8588